MTNRELIEKAIEAKKYAMSPTNYHVGAALLTLNGNVYTGCNLGSNDGIFNICAERVAICKMLSEGEKTFNKIAVVGGHGNELSFTTPCGVCRQLISEFGNDIEVILGYRNSEGEITEKAQKISELLPGSFSM